MITNNGWMRDESGAAVRYRISKEECAAEAKKYVRRAHFQKLARSVYSKARKMGWLDEVCAHMEVHGGCMTRQVYTITSTSARVVYVGLSHDPETRYKAHLRARQPAICSLLSGLHQFRVSPRMSAPQAAALERASIAAYRDAGLSVVNVSTGGALGGATVKWTLKKCRSVAVKHSTRVEFQRQSKGAYQAARKYGWLADICGHMSKQRMSWTREICVAEAKAYSNISAFKNANHAAYSACFRLQVTEAAFAHMERAVRAPWTFEECKTAALMFQTRGDFENGCGGAYQAAHARGWIDDICQHMRKRTTRTRSRIALHGHVERSA